MYILDKDYKNTDCVLPVMQGFRGKLFFFFFGNLK